MRQKHLASFLDYLYKQSCKMIADGYLVGDGSWELRILVTDLTVERVLRVTNDLHIGGVMLKLVEDLGKFSSISEFVMNTIGLMSLVTRLLLLHSLSKMKSTLTCSRHMWYDYIQ